MTDRRMKVDFFPAVKHVMLWTMLWGLSAALHAFERSDSLTLLFVGDLMQHKAQLDAARTPEGKYDYSECFPYVEEEIRKADIAVGNLEVPLGGSPYTGYPAFSAPDEWLQALCKAGFDVFLTANNHCLDRGGKGLVRTLEQLQKAGVKAVGTYADSLDFKSRHPLLVEQKGFRIVFLNYTYGTNGIPVPRANIVNGIDKNRMRRDIQQARSMKPDAIIACLHWGIEYRRLPEKSERELAEWLLEMGVDHVIGGHPHVVQPIEVRPSAYKPDRSVVAYSLGNFISNMSQKHTDGGLMLKLVLKKRLGRTRLDRCAYSLVWTSRPPLSGKKRFTLYPASMDANGMTAAERLRMGDFLKQTRALFQERNIGIKEEFLKKNAE